MVARIAHGGFKDTLNLDSSFAPAYAALARTYSMEWVLTARGDRNLLSSTAARAKLAIKEPDRSNIANFHLQLFQSIAKSVRHAGIGDDEVDAGE